MGSVHAMDALSIWVITHNPSDFPGKYVVRRHEVTRSIAGGASRPTGDVEVGDTLDEVRNLVPAWAIRFDRNPEDDAVVVESWL
jgi:hypothetical protein